MKKPPSVATAVLLWLVMHAVFVTSAHHHGFGSAAGCSPVQIVEGERGAGGSSDRNATPSSECAACRLHSSFEFEVRLPTQPVSGLSLPIERPSEQWIIRSRAILLAPPDRAPPQA